MLPGTSKYALPSASTGTVPRMRLFSNECQFIAAASSPCPNQPRGPVQFRFGGDSTTRSAFTVPGLTPCMCVPM